MPPVKSKITRPASITLVFFITFCCGGFAFSEDWGNSDQIRAAYIYNALKFTTWANSVQETADTSIHVCLAGSPNPVAQILANELRGRSIQNKLLEVAYISDFVDIPAEKTMEKLKQCQMLYIGQTTPEQERYLLTYSASHSILTVSDSPQFSTRGGMIELKIDTEQHRVLLVINVAAANKSNISFSSKLLQVSEIIKQ